MWYVYILQSLKDAKYYIGSTGNLEQRIIQHNMGATVSTKNRRPFILVYFERYQTKAEALRREKQIKSYKGGNAFKKLFRAGSEAVKRD
jgi:putative endonuclease